MKSFLNRNSIIETNDDAAISKLSCVERDYYQDDFVKYFAREKIKRAPLINRGYFSRVEALRMSIEMFLDVGNPTDKKQIVSFGAGFDTNFFYWKVPYYRFYLFIF